MEPSHINPLAPETGRRLAFACGLTLIFFVVELAGGLLTGSLALIADSSHMAGDCMGLAFAWICNFLARKPVNWVKTYGYHRLEVISGILNAMAIWVVSGFILAQAIKRLIYPSPILAGPMIVIAIAGLGVNLLCAWILKEGSRRNQNLKGAYLHVLSDTLGSVGAIAGGILIQKTGNVLFDPIVSVLICLLIIASSLRFILGSVNILLEGAPSYLNVREIQQALQTIDGVHNVHDLHVWSLGGGMDMLTGHVEIPSQRMASVASILEEANQKLKSRFGIEHSTLQPEESKS